MLEAACGWVPLKSGASCSQPSVPIDVSHKLRVLIRKDALPTATQLLGRVLAAGRAASRDEADYALVRLRVPREAGPTPASTLFFSRGVSTC